LDGQDAGAVKRALKTVSAARALGGKGAVNPIGGELSPFPAIADRDEDLDDYHFNEPRINSLKL
jgi:hypothetical protein